MYMFEFRPKCGNSVLFHNKMICHPLTFYKYIEKNMDLGVNFNLKAIGIVKMFVNVMVVELF